MQINKSVKYHNGIECIEMKELFMKYRLLEKICETTTKTYILHANK